MKTFSIPTVILCACSFAAAMNNSDVLRMVQGTAPTSEIIKKINSSEAGFQLFPADVRHLRDRHVPAEVIEAMFLRNRYASQEDLPVQSDQQPPPPRSRNRVRGEALIVNESTPVRLRLVSNLVWPYTRLDDKVYFEALEDVLVSNASGRFLVIPREAPAWGTITAVNPTRIMGHYGTIEVTIDYVTLANGDRIALRGTERGDRHMRPGLLVFLLSPVGVVVQPKDPVWLTPVGKDPILKDGLDLKVWTDGVANLDSSEFEQR